MGLKWASQLITQIWKLIFGHWLHRSKLNLVGEALDGNTKELVINTEITDEHIPCQDTLPYCYIPYFITHLFIILDTLITARKR